MVHPGDVGAEEVLVQYGRFALHGDVGDPDGADAEAGMGLAGQVQLVPEGLVQFFREAIGVAADDGDVAGLGRRIVKGRVLSDGEVESLIEA